MGIFQVYDIGTLRQRYFRLIQRANADQQLRASLPAYQSGIHAQLLPSCAA
jgi:hypothetical protein